MENVWSVRKSPQVLTEEIDGFLACYSASTGQTHILDAFPAAIVRSLTNCPRTAAALKSELAEVLERDEVLLGKIDDVLAELACLQLVDVVPR